MNARFVIENAPAHYRANPIALDSPEAIDDYFHEVIRKDWTIEHHKENLIALIVDSRLNLIGHNVVSSGTLTETTAHPREIFRTVLASNGYGISLIHNHPSGDPSPSRADRAFTKRIVEASELMQIRFLDHLVVTDQKSNYYSFRENGLV